MIKLDRARPFGEVIGDLPYRYEQDGKFFDVRGNQVTEEGAAVGSPPPKAAKASKQAAVAPLETDQVAAQLEG